MTENTTFEPATEEKAPEITIECCPFCGGTASLDEYEEEDGTVCYAIICQHCSAEGGSFVHPEYAVEHWNRRDARDATLEKARTALQFTRQYAVRHDLHIGECRAWDDLKKLLGCTGAIPEKHEFYPGIFPRQEPHS